MLLVIQSWFLVFHLVLNSLCHSSYSPVFLICQSTCHYTFTVLVSGLCFWSFSQPVITFLQSWFLVFVSGLSVNLSLHFYCPDFWSCFWSFSQNLSLQSQFLVFQSTYVSLHYYSPDLWSFSHAMPIHFAIPVSGFLTNIRVIETLQL